MTTKFNVGDTVLIKGIVETIYVETKDNEPVYLIRIKGAGEYEAYGIRVKENVMNGVEEHKMPIPKFVEDKTYTDKGISYLHQDSITKSATQI